MQKPALKTLKLKFSGERRLQQGHPWIFSNELEKIDTAIPPGEICAVARNTGEPAGIGFFNPHCLIAVRLLKPGTLELEEDFVGGRLKRAMEYRKGLGIAESGRMFFGESDGLPGLIVDKYQDILVVEIISAGAELLKDEGIELPETARRLLESKESEGMTSLLVTVDRHPLGMILISDILREDARATIDKIKGEGVSEIWMLTGDNENVAAKIAKELGVSYEAKLYPEEKVQRVKEWRRKGRVVAMVGDGVNDAPALAAADIGIAMGAVGTDVAIETADIALMTDELLKIPGVIRLSRRALRVIKENIVFAIAFNTVLIFLSANGWMTMILGAILHQGSSLLVILNSMRLLRKNIT